MKKYILQDDTMKERENLKKKTKKNSYPRGSIITTDKEFLKIDNDSMCGTQWTWFYKKGNNSWYFDSFGGSPGIFSYVSNYQNQSFFIKILIAIHLEHIAYSFSI